jgi:hypothetical protein
LAKERNYFRRTAGHVKIRVAGGLAATPAEAREAGERMGPVAAGVRVQSGAASSSASRCQEIALRNRERPLRACVFRPGWPGLAERSEPISGPRVTPLRRTRDHAPVSSPSLASFTHYILKPAGLNEVSPRPAIECPALGPPPVKHEGEVLHRQAGGFFPRRAGLTAPARLLSWVRARSPLDMLQCLGRRYLFEDRDEGRERVPVQADHP